MINSRCVRVTDMLRGRLLIIDCSRNYGWKIG